MTIVLGRRSLALAEGEPPPPAVNATSAGTPADSQSAETAPAAPPAAETTPAAKPDDAKAGDKDQKSEDQKAEDKKAEDKKAEDKKKSKEPTFAVVPGPFYNPNLGLGLNVIPMLMFHPNKSDTVSPPSIAILNLLYAVKPPFDEAKSRQSFVVTAASRLFLDEDRWRVVGFAGYINLFQEFYGVGGGADPVASNAQFSYRLEQVIAIAQLYRQVLWKGFYVGGLLGFTAFHTKTDDPAGQATLEALGSGADWRAQPNVGLLSAYDTRANKYYPSQGVSFNLRVNGSFKSDEEYVLLAPSFNQYFPLLGGTDKLVLAYRVFGQFGFGNLPISAYAHYGMRGTTLGYESGEYIDKKMAGLEAEIRWLAWWRLGLEAGTGVGKVFAEFADFPDAAWLPGVWGSTTLKVMEKQDIRARATVAYGKSGTLFYFTVGQNF
ncbi:MAG TPA: BamA/TamA family outer membrane protein [Polyangiaceae bacterium]|nr:BamA/TamA family outer membrane protein [Polyangiaceae bacterium]